MPLKKDQLPGASLEGYKFLQSFPEIPLVHLNLDKQDGLTYLVQNSDGERLSDKPVTSFISEETSSGYDLYVKYK